MRLAGIVLVLVGIVLAVVGTFTGCGSLFTWNGTHAVEVHTLDATFAPASYTLVPEPGRRYTLSIQVVFDREGLPRRDGLVVVEAQMPLVVRVKDSAGTSLAEVVGWLDPNAPPNVLYGQAAHESMRGPIAELAVQRLVGPFIASSNAPLAISVEVGPDRVGSARVIERRLVIHDDTWPGAIKRAFVIASAGAIGFILGVAFVIVGWRRRRRTPRARVA